MRRGCEYLECLCSRGYTSGYFYVQPLGVARGCGKRRLGGPGIASRVIVQLNLSSLRPEGSGLRSAGHKVEVLWVIILWLEKLRGIIRYPGDQKMDPDHVKV